MSPGEPKQPPPVLPFSVPPSSSHACHCTMPTQTPACLSHAHASKCSFLFFIMRYFYAPMPRAEGLSICQQKARRFARRRRRRHRRPRAAVHVCLCRHASMKHTPALFPKCCLMSASSAFLFLFLLFSCRFSCCYSDGIAASY